MDGSAPQLKEILGGGYWLQRMQREPQIKAVEHYEELLRILNIFTEHIDMDPRHKQLIYESCYHLGIAYQNMNQHRKAVLLYSKALQASSRPKKICTVGCSVGTFLHTPVLTRRAFALVKCGEIKKALKDAEIAVLLDSLNPDVYCIRALVWCSMEEEEEAIKDLNYSLRLNPSHACSLILRGNIRKHVTLENNSCLSLNNDQEKAFQNITSYFRRLSRMLLPYPAGFPEYYFLIPQAFQNITS
ncbi:uncharacterized protein PAF06_009563 [Gastrophryne carolinensis]